jgi:ADP-ribose pyrophosphatase YjhB (NUDIX family)
LCAQPLVEQLQFGKLRPTCTQCGWIYFEDPKVAAAALVEKEGKVLLARRVNEPHQGEWTLPAGFVDAYEDPARAAERECLEETGLEVRVVKLLDVIAGREHERGADMVIVYQVEMLGGNLAAGDDADEVGFFPYDQLPALAFEATRRVLLGGH